MKLEEKILRSFIKYKGKEVEGLDLMVAFCEDTWPDDEGIYTCVIMEKQDNGMVWDCECTKSGKVIETIKL